MNASALECSFCRAFAAEHPEVIRAANRWHAFVPCYTGLAVACSDDGASNRTVSEHARRALRASSPTPATGSAS